MPTAKLLASTYYLSSTSYLSVSDAANMYTDCDSDTYATVTNSRASTTSYYIYIRGFDFSSIPSSARVESFSIKFKVGESGVTTSTSYGPKLCDGTTEITSSCSMPSTTAQTLTFSGYSLDWDTLKGYGDDFGIRINCRRSSRNTTSYLYIYGAEIDVTYTIPDPRTITTTLSGSGTISPAGDTSTYDGESFELTITPTDTSEQVTATYNGTDISENLVVHYVPGETGSKSAVLGTYNLVSGGFNGSGASYFEGIVGNGVDASTTTTNYYSSSSSTTAVFTYALSLTGIPAGAEITRLYCQVNGHAESSSQSSEYMCVQLRCGDSDLCEEVNFKSVSTSNTTITLEADVLPDISDLSDLVLQCRLGYYGGAINGATCYIEYSVPTTDISHYTYEFTVAGDAVIAVTIGSSGDTAAVYIKQNGTWVKMSAVYKKINGTWVLQSNLQNVFQSGVNYKFGG